MLKNAFSKMDSLLVLSGHLIWRKKKIIQKLTWEREKTPKLGLAYYFSKKKSYVLWEFVVEEYSLNIILSNCILLLEVLLKHHTRNKVEGILYK